MRKWPSDKLGEKINNSFASLVDLANYRQNLRSCQCDLLKLGRYKNEQNDIQFRLGKGNIPVWQSWTSKHLHNYRSTECETDVLEKASLVSNEFWTPFVRFVLSRLACAMNTGMSCVQQKLWRHLQELDHPFKVYGRDAKQTSLERESGMELRGQRERERVGKR